MNFNQKPAKEVQYLINYTDSTIWGANYNQFCDSAGSAVLTQCGFAFFDKQAKRIPIYFSTKEKELFHF